MRCPRWPSQAGRVNAGRSLAKARRRSATRWTGAALSQHNRPGRPLIIQLDLDFFGASLPRHPRQPHPHPQPAYPEQFYPLLRRDVRVRPRFVWPL